MEYNEAVNTLEQLRRVRPKLGTETTATLLDHLGNPHEDLTAVQIAGSNGKGSTAHTLEAILREAGVRVGLYTSPDLNDVRDRIRVKGRKIPKGEVARFVEGEWSRVIDLAVEGDEPTFFEVFTALALWHFAREEVDIAILEVGIGGRYDATSVVDPVASAVTSVSLEHTDILGSTLEEIAADKAQVAPADAPLVTGASGAGLDSIRAETDVVTVGGEDADVWAREDGPVSTDGSIVSLVGPDWEIETRSSLLGPHQATNIGVAATLARQLEARTDVTISRADIGRAIRNVRIPARFEVMDDAPLTVLDGAHNPGACATLAATLDRFEYEDLHLVFGAMRDKDHAAMCRALPEPDEVYLAEPEVDRAQDVETLAAVLEREVDAGITRCVSVPGALKWALRSHGDSDCILVTGSLYTVAEARDSWTRSPRIVRSDTPSRVRSAMRSTDVPESVRRERTEDMVGRVVRFHARRGMAADLKEAMLELGGTGAVSGITASDEHVEVLLSGTVSQFRDLIRELRGRRGGGYFASQLNDALGIGAAESPTDYPWTDGTAVMGILNVTPDSFHDGGEHDTVEAATAHAREMVADGADIVDVGGESTRPGADPIPPEVERERVVPVVERLADLDAMVSVDTRKPAVAEAALDAGAGMVNDVTGLADVAMREIVADHDVPAVLMHSLSAPVDPDDRYAYDDVVDDVFEDLVERVLLAERAGIDRERLVLDPGLGFGKRAAESFELLDRLAEFRGLGTPIMVGHSHKSMFERVNCGPGERLAPTVAATALAAERGADVVRVHDVAENAAAVATAERTTRTE
jgi:dihydropteroate synthase